MKDSDRASIIKASWKLHDIVESGYLANGAVKNSPEWLEKQRLLLADMALHLLQTSVKPGDIDLEKLTNNLHAILTITDQFLPHAGLKQATESLYEPLS
jgi:hypothetical protein